MCVSVHVTCIITTLHAHSGGEAWRSKLSELSGNVRGTFPVVCFAFLRTFRVYSTTGAALHQLGSSFRGNESVRLPCVQL